MRILQLTSHLDVGGVATHVVSISEALARRGHRVSVASSPGALSTRLRQAGVELWAVPLKTSAECSLPVVLAACAISRRLRVAPVDVIHAHTRVGQVVAAWLSKRHRVPYVATWHGFFRRRLGRRLWPCMGELTIAISEPVAEHLRRDFELPEARIRVVPHGVDVARFAAGVWLDEQRAWREQLEIPADAPVVGTMMRLVASKGVALLLDAFARLSASHPSACLLIVGDGEERPRLEARARKLGIGARTHFVGTLPDARVALALMQVFVFLPAVQEGFGLSLLEAMASARPIVAIRRGGGAPWLLEQSGCAVLVEPDRPVALARAIAQLLDDPQRAHQLGALGLDTAKARYDFDQEVDRLETVYRECLSPDAANARR